MLAFKIQPEQKEFLLERIEYSNKEKKAYFILDKQNKKKQDFYLSTRFFEKDWTFSKESLNTLLKNNLIYFVEKDGFYILTYKGVVVLEYDIELNSEINMYLDDLNKLFFDKQIKEKDKPLKEKEKAILLTTFGLLAFSPDYSFITNENNKYEVKESTSYAIEFLETIYPKDKDKFEKIWDSSVRGEDEILQNFRRLDEIPKKTGNLFKVSNRDKHGLYLDLLDENLEINKDKTLYVLRKILGKNKLSSEDKKGLMKVFSQIGNNSFLLIKSNVNIDKIKLKLQLNDIILDEL